MHTYNTSRQWWDREHLADVNGDGLADLVITYAGTDQYASLVSLANGDGTFQAVKWSQMYTSNFSRQWWDREYMRDVNGDGLADLVATYAGTDRYASMVSLANGDGTFQAVKWSQMHTGNLSRQWWDREHLADVNGDGIADLVITYAGTDQYASLVSLANGDGTFQAVKWSQMHTSNTSRIYWDREHLDDVNGDGLADLVITYAGTDQYASMVSLAKGDGTFQSVRWQQPYNSWFSRSYFYHEFMADVNGDGINDLISTHAGSDGYSSYTSLASSGGRKINKITDGLGKVIAINYKPLTDKSIYTKHPVKAVHPEVDLQIAAKVVSDYTVSDGIGGQSAYQYTYGGFSANLWGRGGGFSWINTTDVSQGLMTTSWFSRDYRNRGAVTTEEQRLVNGNKLISKTDITYALLSYDTGVNERWFSYQTAVAKSMYDLATGSLINTETMSYDRDNFGNVTSLVNAHSDGYRNTTTTTYSNDVANWSLGLVTRTDITSQEPGAPTLTRTMTYLNDNARMLRTQEIGNPTINSLMLNRRYVHDVFGNVTQKHTSGASGIGTQTRTLTATYDSKGQFPTTAKNHLGHQENYIYDLRTGEILQEKDVNGLVTSYTYDGFGRKKTDKHPDGRVTTYALQDAATDSDAPEGAIYLLAKQTTGEPTEVEYFDCLNRSIGSAHVGFDGRRIFNDTLYDQRGLVAFKSLPYFKGTNPQWIEYTYDALGRLTSTKTPLKGTRTITYQNLLSTERNELGQTQVTILDARGKTKTVTDALGNTTTYTYDSLGNQLSMKDGAGNIVAMQYDLNSNNTLIKHPDTGTTTFSYNAFNEMISTVNNSGQQKSFDYDVLGRVTREKSPEETVAYSYDLGTKAIGKLTSKLSTSGCGQSYTYDALGRIQQSTITQPGNLRFVHLKAYDSFSRLQKAVYPSGFSLTYEYNANAYLSKIKRTSDGRDLYTVTSADVYDNIVSWTLGNGLSTVDTYDALGRLTARNTGNGTIQNLQYTYDSLGNLASQKDLRRNLEEHFTHDSLNRMVSAKVFRGGAFQSSQDMGYDQIGNILTKTGVGTYTYGGGNAGPHAVSSISGKGSYTYDTRGNMVMAPNYSASYTSFDLPSTIVTGNSITEFRHNEDQKRYFENITVAGAWTRSVRYAGDNYEIESIADGSAVGYSARKHHIQFGNSVFATMFRDSDGASDIDYFHHDRLGSVNEITNESNQLVNSKSFDAWGKERNPEDWGKPSTQRLTFQNRGFTGHEHLHEAADLIHMNGRVYDPDIGRFLSTDPIIANATDSQNLNLYSYGGNRPLAGTDPSGHIFGALIGFAWSFGGAVTFSASLVAGGLSLLGVGATIGGGGPALVSAFSVLSPVNQNTNMDARVNNSITRAISAYESYESHATATHPNYAFAFNTPSSIGAASGGYSMSNYVHEVDPISYGFDNQEGINQNLGPVVSDVHTGTFKNGDLIAGHLAVPEKIAMIRKAAVKAGQAAFAGLTGLYFISQPGPVNLKQDGRLLAEATKRWMESPAYQIHKWTKDLGKVMSDPYYTPPLFKRMDEMNKMLIPPLQFDKNGRLKN
jgi:RHS repeat-associated protein